MAEQPVLEQMEEFVAMCTAITASSLDKNEASAKVQKIHIDNEGRVNCDISFTPTAAIQKIEMTFNVNDLFIQDGVIKLPDGSGVYSRSSRVLKSKKQGR